MPISKETLNSKLFKVLSKYDPTPLDATGKVTPMEDEADVFKFTFTKDGEEYGDVFATVDDDRQIILYYKDDVTQSPDSPTDGVGYNDSWWGFLEQLATWWPREGFSGRVLKDMSKLGSDMAKRKHMKNKDQLGEGYYPMGRKASYSDAIPTVKIVIEHSRVIEEGEQRYRNINRIFLENQEGERYLLDTKKPGIARVYARHIAEGGKVNDDRWNHVHSLCEEYSKMAGFVRATRNGQFNESAQSLVNEGIAHYQSLRESLSRMTGKRGYNSYFESWTPALMETEGDESNLNELFVQETLDPRIESVMPILNRIHKKVSESAVDKQLSKLEEWADSLVEGPAVDANAKSPLGSQSPAIAHFADQLDKNAEMREEESLTSNNPVGIPEGEGNQEIGQMMADDGITYSAEKENEIISKMVEYMKKSGMDSKQIRYLLNYDEDYIADQLRYLPKEGMDEGFMDTVKKGYNKAVNTLGNIGIMPPELLSPRRDANGNWNKRTNEPRNNFIYWMQQNPGLQPHQAELLASFDKWVDDGNSDRDAGKQAVEMWKQKMKATKQSVSEPMRTPSMTEEGLDANQKRVGQLGPTEKVGKKGAVGKLVGANENFINQADQAVVSEEDAVAEGILDSIKNMFKPKDPTPVTPVTSGDIVTGYKTDPEFKAQIDQIAKQQGMTPEELIKHITQGLDLGADVIGVGEGTHTQQDSDLNPNDYERKQTDWGRDPIGAGTDRIHDKIKSMLGRLKKPASSPLDKRDTDIGSVLEAALPWEDDDEDKDDEKPKDTKGSDGSEHGGHSRAKHLAKQAIPKEKEEVNEMDKSQPSAGRDTGPRSGPDKEAKPISKEKMTKDAADVLDKAMSKEHKKEVKEGQDDLDRILQIMNHRR
jgi:hypothetical protein